jgi:hypothetical protein
MLVKISPLKDFGERSQIFKQQKDFEKEKEFAKPSAHNVFQFGTTIAYEISGTG